MQHFVCAKWHMDILHIYELRHTVFAVCIHDFFSSCSLGRYAKFEYKKNVCKYHELKKQNLNPALKLSKMHVNVSMCSGLKRENTWTGPDR